MTLLQSEQGTQHHPTPVTHRPPGIAVWLGRKRVLPGMCCPGLGEEGGTGPSGALLTRKNSWSRISSSVGRSWGLRRRMPARSWRAEAERKAGRVYSTCLMQRYVSFRSEVSKGGLPHSSVYLGARRGVTRGSLLRADHPRPSDPSGKCQAPSPCPEPKEAGSAPALAEDGKFDRKPAAGEVQEAALNHAGAHDQPGINSPAAVTADIFRCFETVTATGCIRPREAMGRLTPLTPAAPSLPAWVCITRQGLGPTMTTYMTQPRDHTSEAGPWPCRSSTSGAR